MRNILILLFILTGRFAPMADCCATEKNSSVASAQEVADDCCQDEENGSKGAAPESHQCGSGCHSACCMIFTVSPSLDRFKPVDITYDMPLMKAFPSLTTYLDLLDRPPIA